MHFIMCLTQYHTYYLSNKNIKSKIHSQTSTRGVLYRVLCNLVILQKQLQRTSESSIKTQGPLKIGATKKGSTRCDHGH